MKTFTKIHRWIVEKVAQLFRDKSMRQRVAVAARKFYEAEELALRGDYAIAVSHFRRAFKELSPLEQDALGAPAFIDLWDLIDKRSATWDQPVDSTEAIELTHANRLEVVVLGELKIRLREIVTLHRASIVAIHVRVNLLHDIHPALSDSDLEKIQAILE